MHKSRWVFRKSRAERKPTYSVSSVQAACGGRWTESPVSYAGSLLAAPDFQAQLRVFAPIRRQVSTLPAAKVLLAPLPKRTPASEVHLPLRHCRTIGKIMTMKQIFSLY